MGNYNKEYESYYEKILARNNKAYYNTYGGFSALDRGRGKGNQSNFIVRRLMQDLIGVFILFLAVFLCKTVRTSTTDYIYEKSKNLVSTNFDYEKYISEDTLKSLEALGYNKNESLRNNLENYVEVFKSKITGGKTLKESTTLTFVIPIQGKIDEELRSKVTDKCLIIDGEENKEVIASYDGVVKKIGQDKNYGDYIIIDHGNGIETKYTGIKDIAVDEGATVEKGELLGKCTKNKTLNKEIVIFQFLYMGEYKDPEDYISISNNI